MFAQTLHGMAATSQDATLVCEIISLSNERGLM
jgi:hypothetical protein